MERDTADILRKVRKIEIKTKSLSKHLFSGEYHSAFKGRGMSFSEVRSYQYGDDIRDIDWNVTAKTGDAHIKVYEEERELTVMLLIDISASADFGTGDQLKEALITEIAAVIAFSATSNNDKVGAILFTDQVELYLPPAKGRKNILRIIRELLHHKAQSKKTDLSQALRYLANIQKKRAIVFVVSDFIADDYEAALQIAAKRHEIIGIAIDDKLQQEIPAIGLLPVLDPESGQHMVIDTYDGKTREALQNRYDAVSRYRREAFRKCSSDLIILDTVQDYSKVLLGFFKRRGR